MELVMLGALNDFCSSMSGLLKIIGIVLWIFKVVIPIIIVIYGMIDLGKAVMASKDDEIKKALKQLMYRLAAGVLIFFIPTFIMFIFELISDFNNIMTATEFDVCKTCILNPGECDASGQLDD